MTALSTRALSGPSVLRLRAVALGAALALLGVSCAAGTDATGGQSMRLRVLGGTVSISQGDGEARVRSSAPVSAGDRIRVDEGSLAELRLGPEQVFELDGGRFLVEGPGRVRVLGSAPGSILAVAGTGVRVNTDEATVLADRATFRLDQRLPSTVVGVYAGRVIIDQAGQRLQVTRFRRAVIAAGILPRATEPYLIPNPPHRWDRRFLQAAIDLDTRLESFRRGLEAQLLTGFRLDQLLPLAPAALIDSLGPLFGNRARDLILLAMVSQVVERSGDPPDEVIERIRERRVGGASWGLIATEEGLDEGDLFQALQDAVREFRLIEGGKGPGLAPRPAASPRPSPRPTARPAPAPAPSPSPRPTPTPSPSPSDPVTQIVDTLLGILPPLPLPSGTP